MKRGHHLKVVGVAGAFGLSLWLVDALVDHWVFHTGTSDEALVWGVTAHELYMRSLMVVAFIVFGMLVSRALARRKEAEDALRESEERFREFVEGTDDLVTQVDADGRFTYVNHTARKVLGLNPAECVGQSAFSFIHPDDRERTRRWFDECVRMRVASAAIENRQVCRTGAVRDLLWTTNLHYDDDGNVARLNSIASDITLRKQAEEQLAKSEELLSKAFMLSPIPMTITTLATGQIMMVNEAWLKLTGFERAADAIGRASTELGLWADPACRERRDAHLTIGRSLRNQAIQVRTRSGDIRDCLHSADVIEFGGEARILSIAVDITEQKRAESELRASHGFLQTVIDAIPDVTVVINRDHSIALANRAARRIASCDPVLDRLMCHQLCHDSARPCTEPETSCPLEQVVQTKAPATAMHVHYDEGGHDTCVEIGAAPVFDDAGDVVQVIEVCRDITERRRVEEQLRRQHAELAHVARVSLLGEMAAGLAHELNQPLGAICTYVDAIEELRKSTDRDRLDATIRKIDAQARRASEIVQRFRRFARKEEPHPEPVDLNEVIRSTVDLARAEATRKKTTISVNLADRVPPVRADLVQLQQVLLNLVRNSFDAMEVVSDKCRELVISSTVEGNALRVAVQDSGAGISHGAAERMFDPFYTTKPDGMGLGLSISQRIIDSHGGRLWACPRPDGGAMLCFTLPVAQGALQGAG